MKRLIFLYNRGRFHDENWHHFWLEAYLEYDTFYHYEGRCGKSYSLLERIKLHISRDEKNFHCNSYAVSTGTDLAEGLSAKSWREFEKEKIGGNQTWDSFDVVTQAQYERLRKYAFAIMLQSSAVDFSKIELQKKESTTTYTCI